MMCDGRCGGWCGHCPDERAERLRAEVEATDRLARRIEIVCWVVLAVIAVVFLSGVVS